MLVKRIIIAIVTIIFLAAFMLWGTDYVHGMVMRSGSSEKAQLTEKINIVNRSITRVPETDQQAVLDLQELQDELKKEADVFPQSMDTAQMINSLLETAQSCDVTVVPLQTYDWAAKGTNYMVYTISLLVKGDYEDIVSFISRVENELYINLTIVSAEVEQSKNGDSGEEATKDSAKLQLAIYTRA